jgi:hypothetical protein
MNPEPRYGARYIFKDIKAARHAVFDSSMPSLECHACHVERVLKARAGGFPVAVRRAA